MKKIVVVVLLAVGIIGGGLFFTRSEKHIQTSQFTVEEVKGIQVASEDWDVKLVPTTKKKIEVLTNQSKGHIHASLSDGILTIQQKEKEKDLFGGFSFSQSQEITIQLPNSFQSEIEVTSQSGDLEIEDISVHKVTGLTQSGAMMLKNSKIDKLTMTSGDGELSLKNNQTNELKAKTSTGDISLIDFQEKGVSEIHTESGEVAIKFLKLPNNLLTKVDGKDVQDTILELKKESSQEYQSQLGLGENQLSIYNKKGEILIN